MCSECRPSGGLAAARWALSGLALLVLAATVALPTEAQAQTDCNPNVNLNYTDFPHALVVPSDPSNNSGRAVITLFTGTIGGGTKLLVKRTRLDLSCDADAALGLTCTNDPNGVIVEYLGDSTISVGANCLDDTGNAVIAVSNNIDGGNDFGELIFTFRDLANTTDTPIRLNANTSAANGCVLSFGIKVLGYSGDSTPNDIEEVAGLKTGTVATRDAACDNGLVGANAQSGAILLCPTCPGTQCSPEACNVDAETCTPDSVQLPANDPLCACLSPQVQDSTPCTDVADIAGDCRAPGCESGVCVATHIADAAQDSSSCNTTSDVAGDCRLPGCESGACVATHIADAAQNSSSCNTTTDVAGDCRLPGCESGACVATHIADAAQNSSSCNTTGDVAGDCRAPGCEAGVCVATHIADPAECPVTSTTLPRGPEEPIPTLSEWGMALMAALLVLLALVALRRPGGPREAS